MSIVRNNLMTRKGYSPYCGNVKCNKGYPRTRFNGEQFYCKCGWISSFENKFIDEYKNKWNLK